MERLASRTSSKAGSRLLLVSAMTGFSASTTSLAASGSVDNSRLQEETFGADASCMFFWTLLCLQTPCCHPFGNNSQNLQMLSSMVALQTQVCLALLVNLHMQVCLALLEQAG